MKKSLAKYLYKNVYYIGCRPYIPDFVLATALNIQVEESNVQAKYYQRITQSNSIFTYKFPSKLFKELVATCVTNSDSLFGKYCPILCSPLVALLLANKVKNQVTEELRIFLKAKGLKSSFVYLYDEKIIAELLAHNNYHIRFLADLLNQCLPYCKSLPKEYMMFRV